MNNGKLDIDDFFRHELDGADPEQEVPSWPSVHQYIHKRKRERRLFYYKAAAAAGLLLLAGTALFTLVQQDETAHVMPDPIVVSGREEKAAAPIAGNEGLQEKKAVTHTPASGSWVKHMAAADTGMALVLPLQKRTDTALLPGYLVKEQRSKTPESPAQPKVAQAIFPEPGLLAGTDEFTSPKRESGINAGIAVGYQRGFSNYEVMAPVLSPYIQVGITNKLSVSLQPTLAYNHVGKTSLGNTAYHANLQTDIQQTSENTPNGVQYNYNINMSYDSVSVGHQIGSGYWQAELPVYAQYKVQKKVSLFAGLSVRYTGGIEVSEQVTQVAVTQNLYLENQPQYLPQGAVDDIVQQAVSTEEFTPAATGKNVGSGTPSVSLLAGAGVKYQLGSRWGIEVMGNKHLSSFKNMAGKELRSIHQQGNVRISLLYQFSGRKGK